MDWIKNSSIMLVSIIFSLILVEFGVRLVIGNPYEESGAARRIMLFQAPDNFVNVDDIFKYMPNKTIRSETFYGKIDGDFSDYKQEYAYNIDSNNLGLVQNKDISKGESVHLLLGDSFTEGQGSKSWFYDFEAAMADRIVVNGGLLGTGPMQWLKLLNHLEKVYGLKVDQLTVILIGDDIRRSIWNFTDVGIACLEIFECTDSQGDFFGFDFVGKSDSEVRKESFQYLQRKNNIDFSDTFSTNIKKLMKKSALIVNAYLVLKNYKVINNDFKEDQTRRYNDIKQQNLNVLEELHNRFSKTNFVLVSNFGEILNDDWDSSSKLIIRSAEEGQWNISQCWLSSEDYHINDGHPNKMGYVKLRECVQKASL